MISKRMEIVRCRLRLSLLSARSNFQTEGPERRMQSKCGRFSKFRRQRSEFEALDGWKMRGSVAKRRELYEERNPIDLHRGELEFVQCLPRMKF